MTLRGRVENGVVVFQNGAALADGTLVEVTPLKTDAGSRMATTIDPFAGALPVSKERREALLGLIGLWKTEHPPDDEEVERIIEQERMKKYTPAVTP